MSNAIADFVDSGYSTGMTAASSSIHSKLASPDKNNARKSVEIQQLQKNSQHLVRGLIPGSKISRLQFQLYRQSSRQQFPAKHLRIKLDFFFEYRVRSKKNVIQWKSSNFWSRPFHFTSFSFNWSPDLPYHLTLWARVCIAQRANFFVRPFVGILSQIKLLFGLLVIQLLWYILKQLFTSVAVKVVDIYLHFGE